MFFWFIYILASLYISSELSRVFINRYYFYCLVFTFTFLVTPSVIQVESGMLSPAIFDFFYNIIFDLGYSILPLRPLLLTLPTSLVVAYSVIAVKRKFF